MKTLENSISELDIRIAEYNDVIKHSRIQRDIAVSKLNFLESLVSAVKEAGGRTEWIHTNTTLQDMLDELAQNDILFYYGGKDRW